MSYSKIKTDIMVKVARWFGRRPVTWLMRIGKWLGHVFYYLPNARKRVALTNLRLCFPEHSQAQIKQLLKANLISTGQGVMEMLAALWADDEGVSGAFEIQGLEHLLPILEQGKGCLLLSCHTTSIEWGIRGLNHHLKRIEMPVGHMLARQHNNKLLEAHLEQARLGFVEKLIDKKNLRSLLKSIHSGHPVYYAPDQNFSYQVVFADFFGRPAATTTGTHKLAQKGVKIIPWFCFRTSEGRWVITLLPELSDLNNLNEIEAGLSINGLFETQLRQYPEQYLWVHRRFKNQPDGYANPYK